MKCKMKKNIILFLVTLLFVFLFGSACSTKNQGQSGTANIVTEVKINRTELVLPIYGEYELKITKNNVLQEAVWTSNNGCVSVSENGKIVALEAGNASITAIYEGQEFVCEVTVVMTDTIPLLDVNTGEQLILECGDSFVLVPSLEWEGDSIAVEQVEYQSTLRVETNEDLSATIYAETAGQYNLTVIVKWHGLNLYKQINVLVK